MKDKLGFGREGEEGDLWRLRLSVNEMKLFVGDRVTSPDRFGQLVIKNRKRDGDC